jgi:Bifunctional DNA primase/polymerase, N-terminal
MSHEFLETALRYAAQGFAVFPCKYCTKQPALPGGFYAATTNPETIRRWFGGTCRYNVAIAPAWHHARGCSMLIIAIEGSAAFGALRTAMARFR